MVSSRPHEFELIAQLFAPLTRGYAGAFALKDDAAIVEVPAGHDLVTTADAVVEGVHFFAADPPDLIARKALRVNLSDLAAKGAEPLGYLLTLLLPADKDMAWLTAFARGLSQDGALYNLPLLGGDTSSTPGPLSIAITAFGAVPKGQMIRRSGAQPGDLVFVSGTIGDAGGGLEILKAGGQGEAALIRRYHLPEPRLALGQSLRGIASACCDVSDGLLADLGHIAEASGVRIVIEAEKVPMSPALRALWGDDAILRAVTAGDDYELAFTAPRAGSPAAQIGRVEAGAGIVLVNADGGEIALSRAGWTHF